MNEKKTLEISKGIPLVWPRSYKFCKVMWKNASCKHPKNTLKSSFVLYKTCFDLYVAESQCIELCKSNSWCIILLMSNWNNCEEVLKVIIQWRSWNY
jgi:hypothetical protein